MGEQIRIRPSVHPQMGVVGPKSEGDADPVEEAASRFERSFEPVTPIVERVAVEQSQAVKRMLQAGVFRFSSNPHPALVEAAATAWSGLESALGARLPDRGELAREIKVHHRTGLIDLGAALEPPDVEVDVERLRDDLLRGLSFSQMARRVLSDADGAPEIEKHFQVRDEDAREAADRMFEAIELVLGDLPDRTPLRSLGQRDARYADRIARALHALDDLEPGPRKEAAIEVVRDAWLGNDRPLRDVADRLDLFSDTGYLLSDTGPDPSPYDDTGWSRRDVERIGKLLRDLPPQLARVKGLHYITRDAFSEAEAELFADFQAKFDAAPLAGRLRLLGPKMLLALIGGLDVGAAFGTAYYDHDEVRLYNELFKGSRIPGLKGMLAYTTIHEIGHHHLYSSAEVHHDWKTFFEQTGREEAFCDYQRNSIDECYAVALGTYAVAPSLLRDRSPETYRYFRERFGDSLKKFKGGPIERLAIELTYKLGDL